MRFRVRCKKHLARGEKWLLEAGKTYEAERVSDDLVDVIGKGGIVVSLTLKEFNYYCVIL